MSSFWRTPKRIPVSPLALAARPHRDRPVRL